MHTFTPLTYAELYPIDEAAKKVNLKPRDLLALGRSGKLRLLAGIPQGFQIRLLYKKGLEVVMGDADVMHIPNMLVLAEQDCHKLLVSQKIVLRESSIGYVSAMDGRLTELLPSRCDTNLPLFNANSVPWDDPRRKWTDWVICSPVQELEIKVDQVRVASTAIDLLFSVDSTGQGDAGDWYKADALQYMNQAARIFWGAKNVVQDDSLTHPKAKDIIQWLLKTEAFSATNAKHASTLIRPSFAKKGRPPDE